MAIFSIEINEQCPILMDMITRPKENIWVSEQSANKLQKNDNVKINVVVTHKHCLFSRTDSVQVIDINRFKYKTIKAAENPIDTCAANTATNTGINVANNVTETKVIIGTKPLGRVFKRDELIFEELFETQNLSNWTHANYMHSNAIGDQSEDFTALSENQIELAMGRLLITPVISSRNRSSKFTVDNCKKPVCYENNNLTCTYEKNKDRVYAYPAPVNSGRTSTNGKFSFTYGRIEVNATLPNGDWLFPYIMLMPDKLNCLFRKQIRIAFATSVDLENSRLRGGPVIIQGIENKQYQSKGKNKKKHYFTPISHMAVNTKFKVNGFHNFTMMWTSNGMSWYVDGEKYGCLVNNGEYAEPYHIVLGVGAGGSIDFESTNSKPWKNGDNGAFSLFHRSFQGCCAFESPEKTCIQQPKNEPKQPKKERICSRLWGPQATMAVESVRVFAV